jgi:hypothetical protein
MQFYLSNCYCARAEVLQQSRQNAMQNSYAGERGFASPLSSKASAVGRESTGRAREEDEEAAARENDEAQEEVVRAGLDLAPAAGGKKEAAAAQRRSRVLQPRPPPPATRGKMKEASPLLSPHGRRIRRCLAPPHFCPSPAPSTGAREERSDGDEIWRPCAPLHLRRRRGRGTGATCS